MPYSATAWLQPSQLRSSSFTMLEEDRSTHNPRLLQKTLSTDTAPHPVFNSLKAFCNLQLLHQRHTGVPVDKVQLFHYNTGQKECELDASFITVTLKKKTNSLQNNFSPSLSPSYTVQFLLILMSPLEFMILHNKLTGFGCLVTITSW